MSISRSIVSPKMFQPSREVEVKVEKGDLIKNVELDVVVLQKILLELYVAITKTYSKELLKNDLAWPIALIEMEIYLLSQPQDQLSPDVMMFQEAVKKTIDDIRQVTDVKTDAWLGSRLVIPQILRLTHGGAVRSPVDIKINVVNEEKNDEIIGQLAIVERKNEQGILQKKQIVLLVSENINLYYYRFAAICGYRPTC